MTTHTDKTVNPLQSQRVRRSDLVLVMVATLGTVAYAISFKVAEFDIRVQGIAYAIGWAAAISWLGLGCVLAVASRPGSSILGQVPLAGWFRICLKTMAIGMAILSCGTVLNILIFATLPVFESLVPTHIGILIVSDVVMGITFANRARTLGLPLLRAALLWVFVLNGLFACTLFLLWPRA
ncbi:MAG: hypothetical protein IID41_05530 [Planctomycetes bacterium]|nr:hypothetical protein [Planctomycetota bacterium]